MTVRWAEWLRGAALVLALVAGSWHVATPWFEGLSKDSLLAAGTGGVLLLLSLGLMGTARLALGLVVLFCGYSVVVHYLAGAAFDAITWLEVLLVFITGVLLALPVQSRT